MTPGCAVWRRAAPRNSTPSDALRHDEAVPLTLDWLPTDLHPVAMRIARADECAYAMGELAAKWSFEGALDLEQVRHGDRVTTRVRMIRPIPPRISLLFSEAINHLRAALDNVIWHLVEAAQGQVTGRAATLVNLPIYDDQIKFDGWCRDRVAAGLKAFGAATDLAQRIQSLQPFVNSGSGITSTGPFLAGYTGTPLEHAHPLKLLQGYSNDDKHRAIRVAVPRSSGGRVDQLSAGSRAFTELRAGDVIFEGVWGEPVLIEQTIAVLISRPDPYTALVAPANEISQLTAYVAHTAVPQLVTGLSPTNSTNFLPMKVDLDDSGLIDLDRLAAGDPRTAQERLRPVMNAKAMEAYARPVRFPTVVEEQSTDAGDDH